MSDTKIKVVTLQCGAVQIGRRGAIFPEDLSEREWKRIGLELARLQDDIHFVLADWLNCGREKYQNWRQCSEAEAERYALAAAATSFAFETLRICAWVGRKIGARRNANLSWSHHVEVAALPAQMQSHFLQKAEENEWSVGELRAQRRQALSKAETEKVGAPSLNDDFPSWIWEATRWLKRQDSSTWSASRRLAWQRQICPLILDLMNSINFEGRDKIEEAIAQLG